MPLNSKNNECFVFITAAFNTLNRYVANIAAWLLFFAMLLTASLVLLRYGFNIGSIASQELVTYAHALAFMLGAAYTLQQNEHVRVDIFYQRFSPTQQAWVNACGTLIFLLPVVIFLLASSWQMFINAWHIRESSADAGGLAFVYLLKAIIPLAMFLLVLQAVVELLNAAKTLIIRDAS